MTIELALSGLGMSLFCTLITLLLIGMGIIFGAAMIFSIIKILSFILKAMKGGMDDLIKNVKALSSPVTTNNQQILNFKEEVEKC